MEKKVYSFIIYSQFGSFRKPDQSTDVYLTYDCIPIPGIFGMLGALIGLKGYRTKKNDEKYEFLTKLKGLKIGLELLEKTVKYPLSPEDFILRSKDIKKTFVTYVNHHGYGSNEQSGTWVIKEQILIDPAYRIYVYKGDCDHKIFHQLINVIKTRNHSFNIYMGKNEFPISLFFEGEFDFKSVEDLKEELIVTSLIPANLINEWEINYERTPTMHFFWHPTSLINGLYHHEKVIITNYYIRLKQLKESKVNVQKNLMKRPGSESHVWLF